MPVELEVGCSPRPSETHERAARDQQRAGPACRRDGETARATGSWADIDVRFPGMKLARHLCLRAHLSGRAGQCQ